MSLILLADLKNFIHMNEVYDDVGLQSIIDGEEAGISAYLGFDLIEVVGDIEYHDGDRSNTILLNNGAVTVAPTVDVDSNGDYTYSTNLVDKIDFVWYPNGVIQLITGGYFPRRQRHIRVTYTHGYLAGTLPNDIKIALKKKMANVYHGSLGVIEIESETPYKIYTDKEIYGILDRYARVQI